MKSNQIFHDICIRTAKVDEPVSLLKGSKMFGVVTARSVTTGTAPRLPRPAVKKAAAGFNLTIQGGKDNKAYEFAGIQPGDVILRPILLTGNFGRRSRLFFLRWAIEHGERKGFGHAMVFTGINEAGEGTVIHCAPNATVKNGIEGSTLADQLRGFPANEVHILRMSDDPQIRARALKAMRFYLHLAGQGYNLWSTRQPIDQQLDLTPPVEFEGETYRTYDKFTCVGAVICAYGLQARAVQLMQKYSAELAGQGVPPRTDRHISLRDLGTVLGGSPDEVFRTIQTIAPTGDILREMADREIRPNILQGE